jgi:hypothetical protein
MIKELVATFSDLSTIKKIEHNCFIKVSGIVEFTFSCDCSTSGRFWLRKWGFLVAILHLWIHLIC